MSRRSRKSIGREGKNTKESRTQAGIYVRLSNEELEESDSIENQMQLLREYVDSKPDFQLVDIFCDNGYTGTHFARPGWKRLMKAVEDKKVNCIIIKDLSRLGRNYIETGKYVEQYFPEKKVRIISVNDGIDSCNKSFETMHMEFALRNLVNDFYAKDISRKVANVMEAKQRQGHFMGGCPPYGYLWSKEGKHKLVVDQETKDVVREIFNQIIEGKGYSQVARNLNERGIVSPAGYRFQKGFYRKESMKEMKWWYPSTVRRIVDNPVYMGDMAFGKSQSRLFLGEKRIRLTEDKWGICKKTQEPLVTAEIFWKAKEVRRKKEV
ncbi:recombinase family protein [Anaeromicropila populeti]|uniref:Site-specific DNA recombinase n=1 Tax=Anaeromicropila populeti TaxID=37658 RepID=A0A1I6JNI0_9FIRM|nr:recombinase family protein [Anaeromicropila populeti]SFR80525.1 Site-specific DNA recombinase [Anaeromicropila populeti]